MDMHRNTTLYLKITGAAFLSLFAHRLRSFLAMLGIIIGVAAVISMLALGEGAQQRVLSQVEAMGSNLLIIRPGQQGRRGRRTGEAPTLTVEDARAILAQVPGIEMISPVVQGSAQFKYLNQNKRASIIGSAVTYFTIRNYEVAKGRRFNDYEELHRSRVCVLGTAVVKELFGEKDALGEVVKIEGMGFRVVGILKEKGDQGWFNPDETAIIPYTTAMARLPGYEHLREIDLKMKRGSNLDDAEVRTAGLLRRRHRIREGKEDDFHVRNRAEMVETAASMTRTFTILLGSVAAISLLVGGIGIMNIMLVSVTERTREIGVRKAIGARSRDILFQFLVEAVIVSGIGGAIGVLAGVGGSFAIGNVTSFEPVIRAEAVVMALTFSAGVGIFFGYYPASRAAELDPIDALQYE